MLCLIISQWMTSGCWQLLGQSFQHPTVYSDTLVNKMLNLQRSLERKQKSINTNIWKCWVHTYRADCPGAGWSVIFCYFQLLNILKTWNLRLTLWPHCRAVWNTGYWLESIMWYNNDAGSWRTCKTFVWLVIRFLVFPNSTPVVSTIGCFLESKCY